MKVCATPEKLRHRADKVTKDATEFCKEFKAFVKGKSCISMTAPQVGTKLQIMAVRYKRTKRVYVLVNPEVKAQGKKTVVSKERTLDTTSPVTITKHRPVWVIMTYMTPDLKKKKQRVFFGRRAAGALHAYEILQGTLR